VRSTSRCDRLEQLDVECITGSVTDEDSLRRAIEGVDIVFNLAGLTCALRPNDLYRTNRDGPGLVARICSEQPQPPVHVLVSSVAAAGPSAPDRPRREEDREKPVSHYGGSKLAGERAARRWASTVPTTIVRPGVVFGSYDRAMVPMLQTVYRLRAHVNPGFFSPTLSLIYVEDLVDILLQAAERGERADSTIDSAHRTGQGVYFAVSPERVRYSDLGQLMAPALLGSSRPVTIYLPTVLAWLVAGGNTLASRLRGRPEILNLDKIREATVSSWACSSAKIERDFGFRPSAPLREQLKHTARWYRETGWV